MAWLSLDEADNDSVRFWTYVLTALDTCHSGIAALLPHIQTHNTPLEQVLTALLNILIDTPAPLLLVLDDFHVITEPVIHTWLAFLLEHLPPQLHLILLARTEPALPLSRLRARGQVLELRTDQLRCTEAEAATFLSQVMHIALPMDVLREAIAHTEGWLVGLQLLGLWLQTQADPSDLLDQLSGSHSYILDYLTEEVLQRQPEEVQTFLLHTAFLDRMCASLCDAIVASPQSAVRSPQSTGAASLATGAQGMLEYLERSNLFVVPLDAQRRWYRYHPLFAEALRYRFEQTQLDQVASLHQRASRWYAEHGRTNDAIQHALLARDWQRAAELIEQYRGNVALTAQGRDLVALRQWIERLPEEEAVRRAEPEGHIRIFADEGAPMEALLAQLRDQDRRREPTPYLDTLPAAFARTEGRGLRTGSLELSRSVRNPQPATLVERLSARELEVLHLLARGASNQDIADALVLALNTVKRHVSNIIAKLGATNRTQSVAQARALGLLADAPSVGSRLLTVAV